jgi:putative sterol carrier protein
MSQIDASDFSALTAMVDDRSKDELNAAVQAHQGGVGGFLDQLFVGLSGSFDPAKAAGQEATVQYEISAPDGGHDYAMRIAQGQCQVQRGRADSPRVTIRAELADLLRLLTGKVNGMQLFMTGKLKVSGDLFFAQTYQGWFDRLSS